MTKVNLKESLILFVLIFEDALLGRGNPDLKTVLKDFNDSS